MVLTAIYIHQNSKVTVTVTVTVTVSYIQATLQYLEFVSKSTNFGSHNLKSFTHKRRDKQEQKTKDFLRNRL